MPQIIILKGQTEVFVADVIAGDIEIVTTNPASGSLTYNLAAHGPMVVPLPGGQVFGCTLPVNGHTLTVTNNTTSGLSCNF